MRPRHRPPPWWARNGRELAAVAIGTVIVGLVVAVAATFAPHPAVNRSQPIPAAAQPTGHTTGTKDWPTVAIPTIGADPTTTASTTTVARPATTRCSRCGERSPIATTPTTTPPASSPAVDTGSTPAAANPAPAAEAGPAVAAELLALVNADRATAGCGPVALHPSLDTQAQAWSDQQAADDTMHHSPGPTGFTTWGENVAAGYDTAAAVHTAWMDSAGHRANILNCTFTLMGAAAADSATGVRYWTEQFGA